MHNACPVQLNVAILLITVVSVFLAESKAMADGKSTATMPRESFNIGWRFERFGSLPDGSTALEPESLESAELDDSSWRELDLPHDWAIEGPFRQDLPGRTGKLPFAGIGWYRKTFEIPAAQQGKRVFVDFDGAMSDSTVFLNGKQVGGWPYGYTSFRVELTDHLRFGEKNVLAVRLDNKPESSRWYPGGGIYRNVWLVTKDPAHISHWGVFVTTPEITDDEATVAVAVSVDNEADSSSEFVVETEIYYEGKKVGATKRKPVESNGSHTVSAELRSQVAEPQLWSPQSPSLYTAVTSVFRDGQLCDQRHTSFGIRQIEFTADRGFLLNGEPCTLQGVCLHHDLGPLGAAVYLRGIERQIELLKEMGCNAIRTSHNPPTPELLDLCDRMGMLVQVEAFDCWAQSKTPNDYGRFFEEWHERDLVSMVRRDRNHPSVIMWSIGNEIPEQIRPNGAALSQRLAEIVRREDSTRPVTAGCNRPKAGFNGFQSTLDLFGYNYKPHLYADFRKANPDRPLYSSESASCVSSRGVYHFPVFDDKAAGVGSDFQVSSYDLYAPWWGGRPESEFAGQDSIPGVMGEFVWTGFDYLGEPTPYNDDLTNLLNTTDSKLREQMRREMEALGRNHPPSRSSYFGIMDLCGFKKDRFFLYQSRWRPELPMAHILPHWNWPDRVGEITPVHVYTSGDEAELFLNGVSLGRKSKASNEYRLVWNDVHYEPGQLTVVCYKGGVEWAQAERVTTGRPVAVQLAADRNVVTADGKDLIYVTARVVDEAGRTVPRSNNLLHFSVTGPAKRLAVGNGDATSHSPFQADQVNAFNGMALLIVRSQPDEHGDIGIAVTAENLNPTELLVRAQREKQIENDTSSRVASGVSDQVDVEEPTF